MTLRITSSPHTLKHEANPVHRNPSRRNHHTQWASTICEQAEFDIFANAVLESWGSQNSSYWGILVRADGDLETLNDSLCHDGRIAKWCRFVGETTPQIWHGYPMWPDTRRECPPQRILFAWVGHRPLSKAKAVKILRGRQCSF